MAVVARTACSVRFDASSTTPELEDDAKNITLGAEGVNLDSGITMGYLHDPPPTENPLLIDFDTFRGKGEQSPDFSGMRPETDSPGEEIFEWWMLEPEAELPPEAVHCLGRIAAAVELPGRHPGDAPTVHFLEFQPLPRFEYTQLYSVFERKHLQVVFLPPLPGLRDEWRLVTGHTMWSGRVYHRAFSLGNHHPCIQ